MTKTITIKDWNAYKVWAEPTATNGMIKEDTEGVLWAWASGGKRVTIKKLWG